MTEIRFYHMQSIRLEQALPQIVAKALDREHRIVIKVGNAERLEWLNTALWTHDPASFIPHGAVNDGHAAEQPVWLTTGDDNPNGATVLVLTDGAVSDAMDKFPVCCDVFDGNDADAVSAARIRWKAHKDKIDAGEAHTLAHFKSADF